MQATFVGGISVTTNYWTFNGQAVPGCTYPEGSGDSGDPCYTIHFWNKTSGGGAAVQLSAANTSYLTFNYVEMEGTGQGFPNNNSTADKCGTDNCGAWGDNAIYTGGSHTDNLYVGHSYAHHTGNTQFQMNGATNNTLTWEYNWIAHNHTGTKRHSRRSLFPVRFKRFNPLQRFSGR